MLEETQKGDSHWTAYLAVRRLPLCVPLLLFAPALALGFLIDDYFHVMMLGDGLSPFGIETHPVLDLFRFFPPDESVRALIDEWGTTPWWAPEGLRASFFRPVAVLTHMLDHALWPNLIWLHHLHSMMWGVLTCFAVRSLYRASGLAGWSLGIAVFFFMVDEAHVMPVAWLANRNILIALCFGSLAVKHFVNWRRGSKTLRWCLAFYTLSLLSAEGGISSFGYMLAWSLVYEDKWVHRLRGWLPLVALTVLWRAGYNLMGYGEWGSGIYTDPLSDPLGFITVCLQRLPTLILGQWLPFSTELTLVLPNWGVWVVAGIGCALILILMRQFGPLLHEDPSARFWALGMIFSLIPVCATIPMNRVLCFAGVGAFALLALFLNRLDHPFRHPWFLIHGPLAVVLCVAGTLSLGYAKNLFELPDRTLPDDITTEQHIMYFSGVSLPAGYALIQRLVEHRPIPRSMNVLSHCTQDNLIERIDERTLAITASNGWFNLTIERMFRSERLPMRTNTGIDRPRFTAEVVRFTSDGRPKTVHFRFEHALEDPRYRWMCFKPITLFECEPPSLGQKLEVEGMMPW